MDGGISFESILQELGVVACHYANDDYFKSI
jgi:hypothetical protein